MKTILKALTDSIERILWEYSYGETNPLRSATVRKELAVKLARALRLTESGRAKERRSK